MKNFYIALLLLICCVFFLSSANCEENKLPWYLQHYIDRNAEFDKENMELKNIVFVGDSLTEGFDLKKFFPEYRTLNRGIVSDTIGTLEKNRGVINRLDNSVFDCNPECVFILIGVNDIGDLVRNGSPSLDIMEEGYDKILNDIKEKMPELPVYIQSCLPATGRYANLNPYILDLNNRIIKLSKKYDYPYIDIFPLVCDDKGELKEEITRDGIHLKENGYTIWADKIKPVMEEFK